MNQKWKKILKAFIVIYLLIFIIINWHDISWIFNYRTISGLLYDFFNPYQNIYAFSDFRTNNGQQTKYIYSPEIDVLRIPSLGILAPVVLPKNPDINAVTKDLNEGVVYYPGSVLPGQVGQTIVLGHSAPNNWPKIRYDWVFSDLNDLSYGDQIHLYFNNKEYIYYVREKKILKKGEEIIPTALVNNGNVLVLVSCWPPGKNLQRIAVQAELITY